MEEARCAAVPESAAREARNVVTDLAFSTGSWLLVLEEVLLAKLEFKLPVVIVEFATEPVKVEESHEDHGDHGDHEGH